MSTPSIPYTASPSWPLPPGMRATRATRALGALYQAQPQATLSVPEVAVALDAAGVQVNRVTVYRLLDRFAAAGLLQRQIDGARVTRFALATQGYDGAAPRFGLLHLADHFLIQMVLGDNG